ncbi:Sulfotransferase domain-containing protein [Candidatus Magnetomoraceae bacterium gMMP-1]
MNAKNDLGRRIKRKIFSKFYIDYGGDYKNTIIVAGVGRSGTTWLSNIINYKNDYRYMFEPFDMKKVNVVNALGYKKYLRSNNHNRIYFESANAILTGNIKNNWIDYYNRKFISQRRLLKDIRINLILNWIYKNFPGISLILLIRHPCAVAVSKIKRKWDTHLNVFLSQKELMEDFLYPFEVEIKKADSVFEKFIFMWCIENFVPLKQFKKGEIHLVFYENLCERPKYEIKQLFRFLNIDFDEKKYINLIKELKKPSELSGNYSAIKTGDSLIENWKKYLNNDDIKRAFEILNIFGLNQLYSDSSSMPYNNNCQ